MGLFHLLHEAADLAKSAVHTVGDAAGDIEHVASSAGGFLVRNWTTIASAAVSTVVFVGVTAAITAATGGAGLPLALAVAATASGATGYVSGQLFRGQPIDPRQLAVQTAFAAATTLATGGLARLLPTGLLARVAAPVVARFAPEVESGFGHAALTAVENAALGGAVGGAVQEVQDLAEGRSALSGLGPAILGGSVAGALSDPAERFVSPTDGGVARARLDGEALGDTPEKTARIDRALDGAPPDALSLIDSLMAVPGAREHAADFFDGAHIVVDDGGKLYDQWRALPGATERVSSHASDGAQYQISGDSLGPILFAKTADGKGTWVQLEAHRADLTLRGAPDLIPHMVDYVKYKLTGRNQSRFGSSEHTDKNSLVLEGEPSATPGMAGALGELGH